MYEIAREYQERYGRRVGARTFTLDLMRDDPAQFKAGYSLASAVLATATAFDLTAEETERLRGDI